jgi:hypothetical protein
MAVMDMGRKRLKQIIIIILMTMMIKIQFNSVLVYLRANLTAERPNKKLARVHRRKQQKKYKLNAKEGNLYNKNNSNNSMKNQIYH